MHKASFLVHLLVAYKYHDLFDDLANDNNKIKGLHFIIGFGHEIV